MRSALYYPDTEIRSESLWKTALMLWDRIFVIVPASDYQPDYRDSEIKRCFELIGRCHYPSEDERNQTQELVGNFVTTKLPEAFSYRSAQVPQEVYEFYPQKLLPETWEMLKDAGLAGDQLPNADYPMSRATGLKLMSLLADCCAGDNLTRVTDHSAAYATLAGLLTERKVSGLAAHHRFRTKRLVF